MQKVKFTWEDARAKFDKLAPQVNEQKFRNMLFKKRLVIVVGLNQCLFTWLEDGSIAEDFSTVIWTDVYARDFYQATSPGVYTRSPIGVSVKYIYNRVNQAIESKFIPYDSSKYKESKTKHQVSISEWDLNKWDRSSYVAPVSKEIVGYLGVPGWEGSKISQLAGAQGNVLGLLRNELQDAIIAGYIPNDLNATIRKDQDTAKNKYILTMTFNLKREDALNYVDGLGSPNKLKSPYRELYIRIMDILNAFNYNKLNYKGDYIDIGYTVTIVLNYLD